MDNRLARRRIHPEVEEPIEAFFARRSRRTRIALPLFALGHDEVLADVEPGRIAWRAAGSPTDELSSVA